MGHVFVIAESDFCVVVHMVYSLKDPVLRIDKCARTDVKERLLDWP